MDSNIIDIRTGRPLTVADALNPATPGLPTEDEQWVTWFIDNFTGDFMTASYELINARTRDEVNQAVREVKRQVRDWPD